MPQILHQHLKKICIFSLLLWGLVIFFPGYYTLMQILSIVVPLIVILSALILNLKIKLDKWTIEVCLFLSFWLIYGLISFLWAKETTPAIEFTRYIFIYLLAFIIFSQLLLNSDYLTYVPLLFQIIIYLTCLVYAWELVTWNHLSSSRLYGIKIPVPTGVYYNENTSAVFLTLLTPFLSLKTVLTSTKIKRLLALIVFFFILVATAVQSSRIALFVLILFGIYKFIKTDNLIRIATIIVILLGSFIFVHSYPKEYALARIVLVNEFKGTLNEKNSYHMKSSKTRLQLNRESINMAIDSKFFGIGAGNYENASNRIRYSRNSWVTSAHNWWLELLATYGLIICLGMIFMYLRWLLALWSIRAAHFKKEDFAIYDTYFISFLFFILAIFLPSSIEGSYSVWVYFAVINAICHTYSTHSGNPKKHLATFSNNLILNN